MKCCKRQQRQQASPQLLFLADRSFSIGQAQGQLGGALKGQQHSRTLDRIDVDELGLEPFPGPFLGRCSAYSSGASISFGYANDNGHVVAKSLSHLVHPRPGTVASGGAARINRHQKTHRASRTVETLNVAAFPVHRVHLCVRIQFEPIVSAWRDVVGRCGKIRTAGCKAARIFRTHCLLPQRQPRDYSSSCSAL